MKKRLFQILDELNVEDYDKKQGHSVIMGNTLVSADYKAKSGGTVVAIGVAGNHCTDLVLGKKVALLVLVDKAAWADKEIESLNQENGTGKTLTQS